MAKLKIAGMDYNGGLALGLNPRLWSGAPTQRDHLPSGLNSWLQQSLTRANFSKRIFATSRTAIGRIWTILWGSKAGPRGHILGPLPAPGGPTRTNTKSKQNKNNDFSKKSSDFFKLFLGPPWAGNGPKMCPRGPAFEPQSIVQIRPMAARLVAKVRFGKNQG